MDPVTLLIIAAVGWFLYSQYESGALASTVASTTSTTAIGTAASIAISGPVTQGQQSSLQANVIINGVQMPVAVVPNGDAFDPTSWTDITASLASSYGVTPAQIYALMSADYMGAINTSATTTVASSTSGSTNPLAGAVGSMHRFGNGNTTAGRWGGPAQRINPVTSATNTSS